MLLKVVQRVMGASLAHDDATSGLPRRTGFPVPGACGAAAGSTAETRS
ncbi:hypothetical protein [Isoptericola variabilis]